LGNSPITGCHLPKNTWVIGFTMLHLIRKINCRRTLQWKKEIMINGYGWV
jgi:hypothetical protein